MNDFTKEEVEDIELVYRAFCGDVCGDDRALTNLEKTIMKKLKSTVDNYCEHEWRLSAIDAIYCPHCQKHVEYKL